MSVAEKSADHTGAVKTSPAKGRMRRWMKELVSPSSFVGHVLVLVGWTAVAQAVYMLTMPIISRIFTVEAFGNLAVLQSVTAFIIVISALRYEVAILLPKNDETAFNVLALALGAVVVTSGLVVITALLLPSSLLFKGQMGFLSQVWWLIPITQLGAGGREALTHWAIRRKEFTTIAKTKISQVAWQVASQLGLGFAGAGPIGLYIGDVAGRVGGTGTLLRSIWLKDRSLIRCISVRRMIDAARTYKSFPLFSIWAVLLSTSSRNLVTIVIAMLYGATSAGWYALTTRVIAAPMELICRSFSQVYMGEASRLYRENPAGLKRLYWQSARKLLLLAAIPSLILLLFGPHLFGFAFGAKWIGAGLYSRCLAVMLFLQFVNFPLVHTLNIVEKQSWQLAWDAGTLVFGTGGIIVLHRLGFSDVHAVLWYACSMAVMFAVHLFVTSIAIDSRIHAFKHSSEA